MAVIIVMYCDMDHPVNHKYHSFNYDGCDTYDAL
jgi:hypothetical protein